MTDGDPNNDSAKELELCIAYGNISFSLLKYLFTPGEELTTLDMGGKVSVLSNLRIFYLSQN